MSKLVLLLAVPAIAGLAAWNVSLSSEIADLRSQIASGAETARPAAKESPAPGEARVRETPRSMQQVNEIAARLAEVERRLPSAPAADATAGGAPDAAGAAGPAAVTVPSDVVTYFASDAFRGAVQKVLDDRDAARQKERMERVAEARARFLLRDLTVTDAQRNDVKNVVLASLEKIERIRENEAIPEEQRRQEVQAAQQEQVESLAAVLDAQTMEQVRQRAAGGGMRRGGQLQPGGGGRRVPGAPGGGGDGTR